MSVKRLRTDSIDPNPNSNGEFTSGKISSELQLFHMEKTLISTLKNEQFDIAYQTLLYIENNIADPILTKLDSNNDSALSIAIRHAVNPVMNIDPEFLKCLIRRSSTSLINQPNNTDGNIPLYNFFPYQLISDKYTDVILQLVMRTTAFHTINRKGLNYLDLLIRFRQNDLLNSFLQFMLTVQDDTYFKCFDRVDRNGFSPLIKIVDHCRTPNKLLLDIVNRVIDSCHGIPLQISNTYDTLLNKILDYIPMHDRHLIDKIINLIPDNETFINYLYESNILCNRTIVACINGMSRGNSAIYRDFIIFLLTHSQIQHRMYIHKKNLFTLMYMSRHSLFMSSSTEIITNYLTYLYDSHGQVRLENLLMAKLYYTNSSQIKI